MVSETSNPDETPFFDGNSENRLNATTDRAGKAVRIPHPEKALSAVRIRALKKPGRYADGNGLYLVVTPTLAKQWVLRTVVQGVRRDIGLGGLRLVTLAEAREKALRMRKIAREGGDPRVILNQEKRAIPTFEQAARKVHKSHSPSWKNAKHAAQWLNTLEQYAFPVIGTKPVDRIGTPDVLTVLSPIWLEKAETARRVRQRIKTVFDWCLAQHFIEGTNPVDGVTKGLPKQRKNDGHFAALPYQDVPVFVARLRKTPTPANLAFEFLILSAARTNEVIGATWPEIDMESRTWTIPANRMKAGREHRVPLSQRCLEILDAMKPLALPGGYVFPGAREGRPLSNMAFLMALRRLDMTCTAHGFRSAFRDWLAEETSFPNEVSEMALAHTIGDRTEAAYRRGDLFEKRRELMDAWCAFVCGK